MSRVTGAKISENSHHHQVMLATRLVRVVSTQQHEQHPSELVAAGEIRQCCRV
jgi:hypothetical protein